MRDLLLRYKTTSAIERNQNEKINSKPFILQEQIAHLANGSNYEKGLKFFIGSRSCSIFFRW